MFQKIGLRGLYRLKRLFQGLITFYSFITIGIYYPNLFKACSTGKLSQPQANFFFKVVFYFYLISKKFILITEHVRWKNKKTGRFGFFYFYPKSASKITKSAVFDHFCYLKSYFFHSIHESIFIQTEHF